MAPGRREVSARAAAYGRLVIDGTLRRGDFSADLATSLAPGEVLAVLGPNGAGKTTLLRTIAGLCALASGRVSLGERLLDAPDAGVFVPAQQRSVGMVFQDYRLFPHLTILDNIAYAARAAGVGRRSARAGAHVWLARFGLEDLAERRPEHISGGQAQRVALARALAAAPDVLLFDEPLAALDARTRATVRADLREQLRDFPGPVIVVTHDPLEALVLADRLLVLEGGRVVQEGTPSEVTRQPATDYVARLVGLNLFAGHYDPRTHEVRLDDGGHLVTTPAESAGTPVGPRVLVTLRPSAITLHPDRPEHGSARNVWPGQVAALELLGDRVRVQVTATPPVLVDVTTAAVADLGLAPGRRLWLSAKATETRAYTDPARS